MAKNKTTRVFEASLTITLVDTEETGRHDVEVGDILAHSMEFAKKALLIDLREGSEIREGIVKGGQNRHQVECRIVNTSKGFVR
jgi:hypothetical protein